MVIRINDSYCNNCQLQQLKVEQSNLIKGSNPLDLKQPCFIHVYSLGAGLVRQRRSDWREIATHILSPQVWRCCPTFWPNIAIWTFGSMIKLSPTKLCFLEREVCFLKDQKIREEETRGDDTNSAGETRDLINTKSIPRMSLASNQTSMSHDFKTHSRQSNNPTKQSNVNSNTKVLEKVSFHKTIVYVRFWACLCQCL